MMKKILTTTLAFGLLSTTLFGQGSPYRGLWIGQVQLDSVNEVAVPLDETNNPIAPDPNVPTPTFDAANLRVLIHVNGAGQASLLKDVAVLNRAATAGDPNLLNARTLTPATENDLILVSDPEIYDELPPQPAVRIASATFDFGDSRASEALDAIVAAAAEAIAANIKNDNGDLNDDGDRVTLRNAQRQVAEDATNPIIAAADIAGGFLTFVTSDLSSAVLDAIAAGTDDGSAAMAAAMTLQTNSYYGDTRAVELVAAVQAVATNGADVVHNVASSYADTTDNYQRFIAGSQFGNMIDQAAQVCVSTAIVITNSTITNLTDELDIDTEVTAARTKAIQIKVPFYNDTRASLAVEQVLSAIADTVLTNIPVDLVSSSSVVEAAVNAGRQVLEDSVTRYPIPPDAPTPDFDAFIESDAFQDAAAVVAAGAVDAAISEKRNNGLFTETSIRNAALVGGTIALQDVYNDAARAQRHSLPLDGNFSEGSGDVRPQRDIGVNDAPLGAAGLSATIYLPANHPTNPFRHRRHPDHTTGFNIIRNLRFDFDSMPNGPAAVGYGVERLTGRYREEVLGLHKPLGPDPDNNPIGLKTEGVFDLSRISLIDALNAL